MVLVYGFKLVGVDVCLRDVRVCLESLHSVQGRCSAAVYNFSTPLPVMCEQAKCKARYDMALPHKESIIAAVSNAKVCVSPASNQRAPRAGCRFASTP